MDTASILCTPLSLLYFSLQLQLGKVFLSSEFVTAVRFIKLFFSPLTKNTERKLLNEDLRSQPNKHSSAELSTHTLFSSQRKQK